jgi:two-component system LytT family response regulator
MNLQAVVVDDEPAGRKAVRDHCRAHPDIEVIAECASGVDALEIIGQWRPQVAFIDVQMKPLTGIDVATRLAPEDTPVIVFVTAFDEYAVRAFDLNAVDYLLKPFDAERFARMMTRVRVRADGFRQPEVRQELRELVLAAARDVRAAARAPATDRIVIEVAGRVSFVDPLDIEYVEGDRNYIVIAVGQRSYRVRATLAAIEERLSDRRFVRVHRSVIVNASMIRTVEKWFHGEYSIEMHSGRRFTSGRIYRQRIQGLVLRRRGHPESDAEVD